MAIQLSNTLPNLSIEAINCIPAQIPKAGISLSYAYFSTFSSKFSQEYPPGKIKPSKILKSMSLKISKGIPPDLIT